VVTRYDVRSREDGYTPHYASDDGEFVTHADYKALEDSHAQLALDLFAEQCEVERLTAELAECRKDAERWKWLVSENNKGGSRAKFLICWWSKEGDGYETTNGTSVDGHDPEAIVRLIDNAMEGANA